MAVTTTNLIQGPADLYSGPLGATEPADTAFATAPTSPWVDCGGTVGGVTLAVNQTYAELQVDQLVDVPERRMTKREFSVATSLAEPTLAMLSLAMNGNMSTPATGGTGATAWQSSEPVTASSATQPTYAAVMMDGFAPGMKRRRFIGRKMLQTDAMEIAASKEDQTVLKVTFSGHYVSVSVKPFKIVEGTA